MKEGKKKRKEGKEWGNRQRSNGRNERRKEGIEGRKGMEERAEK